MLTNPASNQWCYTTIFAATITLRQTGTSSHLCKRAEQAKEVPACFILSTVLQKRPQIQLFKAKHIDAEPAM